MPKSKPRRRISYNGITYTIVINTGIHGEHDHVRFRDNRSGAGFYVYSDTPWVLHRNITVQNLHEIMFLVITAREIMKDQSGGNKCKDLPLLSRK